MDIEYSNSAGSALKQAEELAVAGKSEYVMPEHLLKALLSQEEFVMMYERQGKDITGSVLELDAFIDTNTSKTDSGTTPEPSYQMEAVLNMAANVAGNSGNDTVDVPHLVYGILNQEDSYAHNWLVSSLGMMEADVLSEVFNVYAEAAMVRDMHMDDAWKTYCHEVEPDPEFAIVGREDEVDRALMIMCRRERNNPLLVGDHGVGKTAIVEAIASRLKSGDVPKRLQGRSIWQFDIASILAGAQYRGEMEERIKRTMEGLSEKGDVVVLIDNIHEIIGAGKNNESTLDASSLLMPYMQKGDIAFIGTTTFEDFKKSLSRSSNIERMFQRVDVDEPSEKDTIEILDEKKYRFELFHGVKYDPEAIRHAVGASVRYIPGKRLPQKAIDLLDEAGAWKEMHPDRAGDIDKDVLNEILSKICRVDISDNDSNVIANLRNTLLSKVFGQDSAVDSVCEAVYTSKAGLTAPDKPMASFLFVGPTGVGKTQLAKELAAALGVTLHRFDMSEYSEKHTVSKFIGAPAGYVGYDEGGLLTDAIRKSPRCVLLLDEIEKAHQDIFNLLLQVMDYGTMTDAKGQKADFRGAIIIMTSNAGARDASRPAIGFDGRADAGAAMNKEVKNVFAPEFINRLSATVVFGGMTREMAGRIVAAKIADIQTMLAAREVTFELSREAEDKILDLGFSKEYGAREIERTISRHIKPLLVKEILFGSLKNGGKAFIDVKDGEFIIA